MGLRVVGMQQMDLRRDGAGGLTIRDTADYQSALHSRLGRAGRSADWQSAVSPVGNRRVADNSKPRK